MDIGNLIRPYLSEKQRSFLRQLRPENLRLRLEGRLHRRDFQQVEKYCMFIGYPRSGHSLVGQLLNAHRNAIIAHEAHALFYLQLGFSVEQIYALLLRTDRSFEHAGRIWTGGYDYNVSGLMQGDYATLKVIGDKKGSGSTNLLAEHPELYGMLDSFGVPVRIIHHVRNPYDNISSLCRRYGTDLEEAVASYFDKARKVRRHLSTLAGLAHANVIETHHENLVDDTHNVLTKLLAFLELEPYPEYLETCSSVVFDAPVRSRDKISWPCGLVDRVAEESQAFSFLRGYDFGDEASRK